MAIKNPVAKFILQFISWLFIIIGSFIGVVSAICAVAALAGGLEIHSVSERLIFFVIVIIMSALFWGMLYGGIRLKKYLSGKEAVSKIEDQSEVQEENVNPLAEPDESQHFIAQETNSDKIETENCSEQNKQSSQNALVFYKKKWFGETANGEDRILLSTFEDQCVITYERLSRNVNSVPSKDDLRVDTRYRSLEAICHWNMDRLVEFINKVFKLSLLKSDCCSEQKYLYWRSQNKTEFYPMKIMIDGKIQECMFSRYRGTNRSDRLIVKFQNKTYYYEELDVAHGLGGYSHVRKVSLNESVFYLYHLEIPNKNDIAAWIISLISESSFEAVKQGTTSKDDLEIIKKLGQTIGYKAERRQLVFKILALATGKIISSYKTKDGGLEMCLTDQPELKVHSIVQPNIVQHQKVGHKEDSNRVTNEEYKGIHKWVNLIGKPGMHGDVIRIGFGNGKWYLEVTNDGYPNRMAGGGFIKRIPSDVAIGKRLDARKFLQFYHSVFDVELDDFSDPIWIYEPIAGRPQGNIEVVQHLSTKENKADKGYSFEKTIEKREVVKAEDKFYIRVTKYNCTTEANGRPEYSYTENYHVCHLIDEGYRRKFLTADSGLDFAAKSAAYRYVERGTGSLF